MIAMMFDWIIYGITFLILASVFIEGKHTRHPAVFFYGSLVLLVLLITAGSLNWWFYGSKYGAVVVIFALVSLIMTRFRRFIYSMRFRQLVKDLNARVKEGYRIILVLPEDEDERSVLLARLTKLLPADALLYAPAALGPCSGEIIKDMTKHHQASTGYLLVCDEQIPARSWLSIVENGEPETSIAVNFHSIPDME